MTEGLAVQLERYANKNFGYRSFVSDVLADTEQKIHYGKTLQIPIGLDSQNHEVVYLDLGDETSTTQTTNAFCIVLAKTRSGKTVLTNSIADRMALYGGYSIAHVADIKNEYYNYFTQVSRSIPIRILKNESKDGEMANFSYHTFLTEEEMNEHPNIPGYIQNMYPHPKDLEIEKYKDIQSLNALSFLRNLKKINPVFCFSHVGSDKKRISEELAWIIERFYSYAKFYNNYGANIRQRILLVGEEMSMYAEAKGKEIKKARTMMEEIASRGAGYGIAGMFITQRYNGVSPVIRANARYRLVVGGFAENSDRDELLKEMEVSNREEKSFFSTLEFNTYTNTRECLLLDNLTKEKRKFIAFSPLRWAGG